MDAPQDDDKDGWKRIKTLELFLQFNVDEKKDYNKIDFLVSFYRDTIDSATKMFDKKQYCYTSGITPSDYDKNANIIKVMLDYLEWRNKPKSFYILKNEKLDGPIEEIARVTKRMNNEEWSEIRDYIYLYMSNVQSGDRTRDIRELIKSAKTGGFLFQKYKKSIDSPETMNKLAKAVMIKDTKASNSEESKNNEELKAECEKKLIDSFETAKYHEKIETANSEPIELLDGVVNQIKKVDIAVIKNLDKNHKDDISLKINELESILIEIRKTIENE